ncbi:hypothetical protein [Campylobacter concisus]|uniref:hypothetical protein n=1 Tax=Campylobacter concisus TaxID=199 RepID=UPI000CD9C7C6|nr:hypothetical protein [Campylobacter concisus]
MVSLLCGCCGDKPITSFSVSAVLSSKFDVDPCFYRVYEPKPSGENLSFVQFYCNSYSTFFQKQKLIFDTKFFIANCSVKFVNSPNVPLHVVSDNEQNNFWYELGSDFLTPFGETRIVDVPTPSEISAYLSRDLLLDPEDASDYFYFCFFHLMIFLVILKISLMKIHMPTFLLLLFLGLVHILLNFMIWLVVALFMI